MVQRVFVLDHQGTGDAATALALRVRRPGETAFVLVASGKRASRVGVVGLEGWRRAALTSPTADAASSASAQKRWRAQLEGARVIAVTRDGVALEREGKRVLLAAPAAGPVVSRPIGGDDETSAAPESEHEVYRARGAELLDELSSGSIDARRTQLRRALDRTVARLERRIAAIRTDRARIEEAGEIAAQATAFVAAASTSPRGATALTITDWTSGEARERTLPLDPARPARAQIDAMFRRARRLKLGAAIVDARLAETVSMRDAIDALRPRAVAAETLDALEALRDEAQRAATRDFALAAPAGAAGGRRDARAPRVPYRTFASPSGARILVGKGAADNDALTLHVAKPHDLWLHAKGRTGAHVIVPLSKKETCPGDLLVAAAHLAAHFSDVRDEAIVDVQYAPRKFLRKPRGAAPGAVVVDREKVLVLRKSAELLATLLAREEVG